jgi:hypothetical protein
MELISPAEFSRRVGVTPQAVHRAIKHGRLSVLDNGKLDAAVAAIQWDKNRQRSPNAPTAPTATRPAPPPATPADPSLPSLEESKRRREFHEANLAEMRERQKAGELVIKREVFQHYTTLYATLREMLLRIPDKLATRVVAESDADKVYTLLEQEIEDALRDTVKAADLITARLVESAKAAA